jgi:hypothetical protein
MGLAALCRSEVVGVLKADFHQKLKTDADHARGESVFADNFGEVFAVDGSGFLRIRHGDEKAHADLIIFLAGLEIDAGAGDACGAAQILKMVEVRVGGADPHELRDFAAAVPSAFFIRRGRLGNSSCSGFIHDGVPVGGLARIASCETETCAPSNNYIPVCQPNQWTGGTCTAVWSASEILVRKQREGKQGEMVGAVVWDEL